MGSRQSGAWSIRSGQGWDKAERSDDLRRASGIRRVRNAVHYRNFGKVEGADALDAGHINAELARIRAALMMGVDATGFAKVVLRRMGIELIERQIVLALHEYDVIQPRRNCHGSTHSAK